MLRDFGKSEQQLTKSSWPGNHLYGETDTENGKRNTAISDGRQGVVLFIILDLAIRVNSALFIHSGQYIGEHIKSILQSNMSATDFLLSFLHYATF